MSILNPIELCPVMFSVQPKKAWRSPVISDVSPLPAGNKLLSLHTRRGLGGDSPEDINSFAVLRVSVAQHHLQVVVKYRTPSENKFS